MKLCTHWILGRRSTIILFASAATTRRDVNCSSCVWCGHRAIPSQSTANTPPMPASATRGRPPTAGLEQQSISHVIRMGFESKFCFNRTTLTSFCLYYSSPSCWRYTMLAVQRRKLTYACYIAAACGIQVELRKIWNILYRDFLYTVIMQ